jgi:predicted negative regulator of RcsB-dependent stress response
MAYDLEQQETISAIKGWFEENANWLIGAMLLVVLAVGGNWGWRWYQRNEAAAASTLYDQFQQALVAKDAAKARELAGSLVQQHGSSAYASFAALAQARASLEAGDAGAAKAQLHWVIDKSGNAELQTLARVRLAGVLLDEKAYDEGLALLQADAPPAMAAEVSDRRGDLLFAQGKTADARSAYAKALEQAGAQSPLRPIIQSKLDSLPAAG